MIPDPADISESTPSFESTDARKVHGLIILACCLSYYIPCMCSHGGNVWQWSGEADGGYRSTTHGQQLLLTVEVISVHCFVQFKHSMASSKGPGINY